MADLNLNELRATATRLVGRTAGLNGDRLMVERAIAGDHFAPETVLALLDRVTELEAKVARVEAALTDFRDHGLRTDLTPTMPIESAEDYGRWTEYVRRIDNAVRDRARAALLANGIEREPNGDAMAGESGE